MPTDLDAVSRGKREAQADPQTEITIMLVCVIISLGSLMLVFEVFRQWFVTAPATATATATPHSFRTNSGSFACIDTSMSAILTYSIAAVVCPAAPFLPAHTSSCLALPVS